VSDPIIIVENLGKKYLLRHGRRQSYTALRDVLADKARSLFMVSSKTTALPLGDREDFWALKGVSFEVKQREVVGIIGKNGAGKSTLLKILSRITEPTEGRVRIKGRVASLLEVGTGFHPELTGRENIYLNGAILGMRRTEIQRKFDEIVAFAEIEKFLDTPVKRYSSGMYVRLAFAVAAHLEPEILVVDEVLAVGDAEFQKKCLNKMHDVSKGGRTVLFVSHNLAAVDTLCDRGLVLDSGSVVFDDRARDATKYYLESVVSKKRDSFNEQRRIIRGNGLGISSPIVDLTGKHHGAADLVLTFEVESDKRLSNIGFGLAVTTVDGILVSKLAPAVTNFVIQRIDQRVRLQVCIRDILRYLAGGHYLIDVWLSIPRIEILLYAERIGEFHLPPTDPFGVGAEFKHPDSGFVPLDTTFETFRN